MTATPTAGPPPADLAEDVRLARVHLRMGQLTLARAELEDLLGRDALDSSGLAALAEARWRTGALLDAVDAAEEHLEGGGSDPVAICIAAEAAAADGRPDDAEVLMRRLRTPDAATLDALFAGIPRRAFWPAAPADPAELEEIRREAEARGGAGARDGDGARGGTRARDGGSRRDRLADAPTQIHRVADAGPVEPVSSPSRAVPGPREVLEAAGAWGHIAAEIASATDAGARAAERAAAGRHHHKAELDPHGEVARAREEMGSRPDRAFLRLALALRADPTLAPAVLDAVHLRREPAAALLRGDAQRLLGRHLEAEAAFDAAAESLEP